MRTRRYLLLCLALLSLASCRKEEPDVLLTEKHYINTFACSMMSTYYLWVDEVKSSLQSWLESDDPVQKVKDSRYKDAKGNDIDKWTQMLTSYSSMIGSMSGDVVSYGYDFLFYRLQQNSDAICAVVTFCYPGTPAAEASIKRGDVIVKINGMNITTENYQDLYYSDFKGGLECVLTMLDGRSVTLKARGFYENPVLECKTFDCGSKKVGYLHYTSFTIASCQDLIDACRTLKDEGISELVLDLRYNSGGYVLTENLLASMLAPAEAVENAELYMVDVYNSRLAEAWGESETHFSTEFSATIDGRQYSYSTSGCNLGIDKLYVLTSSLSASASESLICGLRPYLPIEIIGEQTSGKYCAGIVESATDWYTENREGLEENDVDVTEALGYCGDWGIYVMISRYADKNKETPCMPDGFIPDMKLTDTPEDGIALGDPSESLLHYALVKAGYPDSPKAKTSQVGRSFQKCGDQPGRQPYRLLLPDSLGSL